MNGIKTDNLGGVPFTWDDWKWEQDGVRQAFYGLLSAWGIDPNESFILSGCEVTTSGSNYLISEGFISLEGEIYKVDAHNTPVNLNPGEAHYWEVFVTYDVNGTEATKNAGLAYTYELRKAKIAKGTPPANYMGLFASNINKVIAEKSAQYLGGFSVIDLSGSLYVLQNDSYQGDGNFIVSPSAPSSGSYLRYNIVGKLIHVSFNIINLSTTTAANGLARSIVIRNLPFNFKSGLSQFGNCIVTGNDIDLANGFGTIEMKSNLIIFNLMQPQGAPVEFNQVLELAGGNSKNYNTISTVVGTKLWNIKGNFVAELD